MKTIAMLLALASTSAAAQTVTWEYSNPNVSGTYESLSEGASTESIAAFQGTLSGSFSYTISGNSYTLNSESFTLTGASGSQVFVDFPAPLWAPPGIPDFCDDAGDCINATASPTLNIENIWSGGATSTLAITADGLTGTYAYRGSNGGCAQAITFGANTGPAIPVCSVSLSSDSAGTWVDPVTAAPEMDVGSAGAAMTLLAGCVAIMGRRRI
jgi:hypothetical protein